MKSIAAMLTILLLAACSTPEQREARIAVQEQADIAECLKLGFRPATPEYGDCRLRLKEMRLQQRAIDHSIAQSLRYPYDYPYRYRSHPWH